MKNKVIGFIAVFVIIIGIVGVKTAYANVSSSDLQYLINYYKGVALVIEPNVSYAYCISSWQSSSGFYINTYNQLNQNNNDTMNTYKYNGNPLVNDELTSYYVSGYNYIDVAGKTVVILKGTFSNNGDGLYYGSLDDYEEANAPTWWERVAQIFTEFATSPAMGAVLSGDWLGYINEVLFGELWSVQVGEGEDELAQFYTVSATPSPIPTPIPTQIPVQVNIDPTTGNVIYHYTIDVSGTPVPTSSPFNPNPPVGTGTGGSELTEPFGVTDYYEPDDSLSIPNLRIFQFQLDLPGSNTDIGVDSLDNNVEVMNGYLEENADAITTVSSFFQVIPSDWFLLLGAIACFPIIAAMIKSLLGG